MTLDFKKLAPWNWFRKEQEAQQAATPLPVARRELTGSGSALSPVLQLQREIDRLFDEAFRGFGLPAIGTPRPASEWMGLLRPALDIEETARQYRITLEVPGVEEKDVEITLDGDLLVVRGEKRQQQERDEGGYHRVERAYGSFERVLNLPEDANLDAIRAAFRHGVLTITVDKREARAPRRGRSIPIEA